MKSISFPKQTILSAANAAKQIIGSRYSMPILSCVRIGQNGLQATNLDEHLSVALPIESSHEFPTLCVPLDLLLRAAQSADPNSMVTFHSRSLDSATIEVSVQQVRLTYNFYPTAAEEYPEPPKLPDATPLGIFGPNERRAVLNAFSAAVLCDAGRYILRGACVIKADGQSRIVGTNGRFLYQSHPFALEMEDGQELKIPVSIFGLLESPEFSRDWLISADWKKRGECGARKLCNRVRIEAGPYTLIAKDNASDDRFPNYRQVFPQGSEETLYLNAAQIEQLLACLNAVPDSPHTLVTKISANEQGMCVKTNESTFTLQAPTRKGIARQVDLNTDFLRRCLAFGPCKLSITAEHNPVTFIGDDRSMTVLMPQRWR